MKLGMSGHKLAVNGMELGMSGTKLAVNGND